MRLLITNAYTEQTMRWMQTQPGRDRLLFQPEQMFTPALQQSAVIRMLFTFRATTEFTAR